MWEVLHGFSDVVCGRVVVLLGMVVCGSLLYDMLSFMFFVLVLVRAILYPRRYMFYCVVPGPHC